MKAINLRYLFIGIAMLAAAGLALGLTPREKAADRGPKMDLETMIPEHFGSWERDHTVIPLQVDPSVQTRLDMIYNQTLSRTYRNAKGEKVMLSIAYGGQQSRTLQVHRPEVCYYSQGFTVGTVHTDYIAMQGRQLAVSRLVATQPGRFEPITYWIRVGNAIALSRFDQMIARYTSGLAGEVPDGVLVRVSTIGRDTNHAYEVQNSFISDLLGVLAPDTLRHLIGDVESSKG
jgi:EpsI family protein